MKDKPLLKRDYIVPELRVSIDKESGRNVFYLCIEMVKRFKFMSVLETSLTNQNLLQKYLTLNYFINSNFQIKQSTNEFSTPHKIGCLKKQVGQ